MALTRFQRTKQIVSVQQNKLVSCNLDAKEVY